MGNGIRWGVDKHQPLTPGVRAFLQTNYGYSAAAEHTYAALVSIRSENEGGNRTCLVTFPFTFILEGMLLGDLEELVDVACRARLRAIRNAMPLAAILDTQHPL